MSTQKQTKTTTTLPPVRKGPHTYNIRTSTLGTPVITLPVTVNGHETTADIYLGIPLAWISRDIESLKRLARKLHLTPNRVSYFFGPAGTSHAIICWVNGMPYKCLPPRDRMDPYYHNMCMVRYILGVAQQDGYFDVAERLDEEYRRIVAKRTAALKRAHTYLCFAMRKQFVWTL